MPPPDSIRAFLADADPETAGSLIADFDEDGPDDSDLYQVRAHITYVLDTGFMSRAALLEDVLDYATDLGLDTATRAGRALLTAEVCTMWNARLAEQREWPETTDADRLEAAFVTMRGYGLIAAMNHTCCITCGHFEIASLLPEHSAADGYVFFHQQGTERLADRGEVNLAHGVFADNPTDADLVSVGDRVVAALTAHGFHPVWDRSPAHTIELSGLHWQKRLPASSAPC